MLISDTIHENDELRVILLNQLKALVPKIDTECKYSKSEMKALIGESISQITIGRDYLRQILDEINTDVIVSIPLTGRVNALSLYHWDNILNAADVSRLDRIENPSLEVHTGNLLLSNYQKEVDALSQERKRKGVNESVSGRLRTGYSDALNQRRFV